MIITVKMTAKTKLTERLRTRIINKEMNKSGDKLLTAQKLSDLEQNSGRMP